MDMAVSAKRCPHCGKFAQMEAEVCRNCGHRFQTVFNVAEPPSQFDRTQAFDAVLLPRLPQPTAAPVRRSRPAPTVLFSLLSVLCILVWAFWMFVESSIFTAPTAFSRTATAGVSSAKDLYDRLNPSMSLYDISQAAGSMGTVARPNTSTLSLSYPFGDQQVRVLMLQRDPQSEDYRVTSVTLSQGRTTLLKKSVDDPF